MAYVFLQQDYKNARLACKFWNEITYVIISKLCPLKVIPYYITRYPEVKELSLTQPPWNFVQDFTLTQILKNLSQLKILNLGGCRLITDNSLNIICSNLKGLEELVLDECENIEGKSFGGLANLNQLRTLSLRRLRKIHDQDLTPLNQLRNLQILDLSFCEQFGEQCMLILGSCQKLESLNLSFCFNIPPHSIQHLKNISTLRSLILDYCEHLFQEEGATYFQNIKRLEKIRVKNGEYLENQNLAGLENLKQLKVLDFRDCFLISDDGLQIVSRVKSLQVFKVKGSGSVTNTGIQYLTQLKNLNNLCISGCGYVDDESLEYISSLTNLRKLDISCCYQITDQGFQKLEGLINLVKLDISQSEIDSNWIPTLNNFRKLCKLKCIECDKVDDKFLEQIDLPYLNYLDLTSCQDISGHGLQKLSESCVSLGTVIYDNCPLIDNQGLQVIAYWKFKQKNSQLKLDGLNQITDSGFMKMCKILGHVNSVDISNCRQLTYKSIHRISRNMPNLLSLKYGNCMSMINRTTAYLESFNYLRDLDIHGCHQIGDKGILRLQNLKTLVNLNIGWCQSITDESLVPVFKRLVDLEVLNISGLTNATHISYKELINLRQLRSISLSDCPNVDNEVFKYIGELPNIRFIDARACNQLTSEIRHHVDKLQFLGQIDLRGCRKLDESDTNTILDVVFQKRQSTGHYSE